MNMSGGRPTMTDVSVHLTVECVDERGLRHEIDTVLGYSCADPFAVSMTFVTSDGDLVWTYGRDLLMRGSHTPTGDGDVHVSPAVSYTGQPMVGIELSSPDGHLVLLARAVDVDGFLARTSALVAPGEESAHLDVDALISQVLAS